MMMMMVGARTSDFVAALSNVFANVSLATTNQRHKGFLGGNINRCVPKIFRP